MKALIVLASMLFLLPFNAPAQTRNAMTIAELVTYSGKDREQVLHGGAKAEGKVTWYTSLAGDSYKGMVKAFESKYPGVKVEVYRVSGSEITTRMTEEARAKRYIADALKTIRFHPRFEVGEQGERMFQRVSQTPPGVINFIRQYLDQANR